MRVIWSDAAKLAYEKLIDNLLENWDVSVVIKLENDIMALEERLKNNKNLCPESKKMKLRKCIIHKLTTLIYRIVNNKQIEVVNIIQNRMNHNY